jgi:hypothetical protein
MWMCASNSVVFYVIVHKRQTTVKNALAKSARAEDRPQNSSGSGSIDQQLNILYMLSGLLSVCYR